MSIGMRPDTRSLLLYAFGTIRDQYGERDVPLDIKDVARSLEVRVSTVSHYLCDLRKAEFLIRSKGNGSIIGHGLTVKGDGEYRFIEERIDSFELVPERHMLSRRCSFRTVSRMLRNPLDRVTLAKNVLKDRPVDIVEMVQRMNALSPLSRERTMLKGMIVGSEEDKDSLEDVIGSFTLIGNQPGMLSKYEEMDAPADSLLILAEFKRRRGEVEESASIVNHLLQKREGLSTDKWIVCVLNMIQTILSLEGQDRALEVIRTTIPKITNAAHLALIRKIEADIYSIQKEWDRASAIYRSCLGTFSAMKMYALQAVTYNNIGVMFFRQGKFDLAEKNWLKARSLARQHNMVWMKAAIEINLSDSYAKKGKIKRAKDLLRESRKVMEEIGDREGLSDVDFNRALVSIEEGNGEKALSLFAQAEEFPLIYEAKRRERREVFRERFVSKGWDFPISI